MTGPRTYGDPSGLAKALDAIGERWALLIVRELAYGPRRFTDLRAALGASPNVLTQRLGELEDAGVVERRTSGGAQYDLSDWGRALHPALVELTKWGAQSPERPIGQPSLSAVLLATEARFVPDKAAGVATSLELRLDGEVFTLQIVRQSLAITRARPRNPDAVLSIHPAILAAALFANTDVSDLPWQIEGDRDQAEAALSTLRS